jgi:hypothetical protein
MEKVPVSTRALIQRINRKLVHDGQVMKAARSARAAQSMGRYYIVDIYTNGLVRDHCSPAATGHEMGVLGAWERVE